MISRELLQQKVRRVHGAAENNHRIYGHAAPLIVALRAAGPEALILAPHGLPDQPALTEIARATGAIALIFTSEAWVSLPGLNRAAVAELPLDDLPHPEHDPDRLEAIITTAVGLDKQRTPFQLTRRSQIHRAATGTRIGAAIDGPIGVYRDQADTILAAALTGA